MNRSNQPAVVEPPTAQQLMSLVVRFLQEEVGPAIENEKLRFRVRVAANLIEMTSREVRAEGLVADTDGYLITEQMSVSAGSLKALTESLLEGERDILEPKTFSLLRDYVERKLSVTAPSVLERERTRA